MMGVDQGTALVLGQGAVCLCAPVGFTTAQFSIDRGEPDEVIAALMRRGTDAGLIVLASDEGPFTVVSVTGSHEAVVGFIEAIQGGDDHAAA
jgi:hypothetical protein